MYRSVLISACFFLFTGIILGAFGAHYLKELWKETPELLTSFETGVKYQIYHGLGLLALGLIDYNKITSVKWASKLISAGTILFSFSIYILCFLKSNGTIGLKGLGILTPIGGILLIAGWLVLMINLIKKTDNMA